jgi:hypothetical protein
MSSPIARLGFALAGLVLLFDGLFGIAAGVMGRAAEPGLSPFAPLLGPLHLPVAFVLLLTAFRPPVAGAPDEGGEDRSFSRGLSVVFLMGSIWCGAMALHLVAGLVATARGLPQGPALTLRGAAYAVAFVAFVVRSRQALAEAGHT